MPNGAACDAPTTLSVCVRCRDGREEAFGERRGGARLADAIAAAWRADEAAQARLVLRGVRCMSQCKRPCAIALSAPGRFSYLFGDLDPETGARDAIDCALLHARSAHGIMARERRPRVLQNGVLGRIPPLDYAGEEIEPLRPSFSHDKEPSLK